MKVMKANQIVYKKLNILPITPECSFSEVTFQKNTPLFILQVFYS